MNKAVMAIGLGLSLAACGIVTKSEIRTEPEEYTIECASPGSAESFKYKGFNASRVVYNTLVLTSPRDVVYYNFPVGTACRVQQENKNNNAYQEL